MNENPCFPYLTWSFQHQMFVLGFFVCRMLEHPWFSASSPYKDKHKSFRQSNPPIGRLTVAVVCRLIHSPADPTRVFPWRRTYCVSASPVGSRLWLDTDVLHYWSGWLLLISPSYYWFTAGVLMGSVVLSVVLGKSISAPSLGSQNIIEQSRKWGKNSF